MRPIMNNICIFHLGKLPTRIRPLEKSWYFSQLGRSLITTRSMLKNFHLFHERVDHLENKIIVEITFIYFIMGEITHYNKTNVQCWNHFHVFHKRVNHLENKTIVEITLMYFTMSTLCGTTRQVLKNLCIFHITGKSLGTIRPLLKKELFVIKRGQLS
jgi:hypothetical protein